MTKKRISGQQVPNHIGSEAILLGNVNKVSSSGTQIELKTTDNKLINITLQEPVDGNISEGIVECHGVIQSKATMLCNLCVHFTPEMCENFDQQQYNSLLSTFCLLGQQKWKLSESDPGF